MKHLFTIISLFVCYCPLSFSQETPVPFSLLVQSLQKQDWSAATARMQAVSSPLTPDQKNQLFSVLDTIPFTLDSIPVLQAMNQRFGPESEFLLQIAKAYERMNDIEAAIQASSEAIAQATGNIPLLYRSAVLAKNVGRLDEAERRLEMILQQEPDHFESLYLLGEVNLGQGDDLEARASFQKIIERDPNHYQARYELGRIEIRVGNFAEAERHLRMAIQTYPFFREAYNGLLVAMSRQRKREEVKQFQVILNKMNDWDAEKMRRLRNAFFHGSPAQLPPDQGYELAAALFQIERHNLARTFLEKALEEGNVIEPELYLLAQLRYRAKDYKGCLELLDKVHYETATQSVTYAALKAWCLYFLNRFEESKTYAESVREKHGNSQYFMSLQTALDQVLSATGGVPVTGTLQMLSPLHFTDVSEKAGLHAFRHRMGNPDKRWIVDAMGSGVAVCDYDKDGFDDIYFVNARPDLSNADPQFKNRLFRNNGNGTFSDVTDSAGVGDLGYGMSAAFGDIDNDGWPDLYVGNYGRNTLYRNNGDGTFTDITDQAKVGDFGYATAVSFADLDKDGDLDLFVGNYVDFQLSNHALLRNDFYGIPVFAGAMSLPPQQDRLYINNGQGIFEERGRSGGINISPGRTVGACFFDLDNDGDLDLYVSNDSTYNHMLANRGNGSFEDISFLSGGAVTESNMEAASLGVSSGDFNNDGLQDLFITTSSTEADILFKNEGNQTLADFSDSLGFTGPASEHVSWGADFADFDSDGYLDLFHVNGHVYPQVDQLHLGVGYNQGVTFYRNDGKKFEEVTRAMRVENFSAKVGRGAAVLDYDNDGDLDVVINCMDSTPQLLENQSPQGNWLQVVLDAPSAYSFGVRVVARNGNRTWTRSVDGGSGYLSQSSSRLHFGFGEIDTLDELIIYWMHRPAQAIPAPKLNEKLIVPYPKD